MVLVIRKRETNVVGAAAEDICLIGLILTGRCVTIVNGFRNFMVLVITQKVFTASVLIGLPLDVIIMTSIDIIIVLAIWAISALLLICVCFMDNFKR